MAYCPISLLRRIKKKSTKKLAIMINEKSTSLDILNTLVDPLIGLVDMVRIAVDPKRFDSAVAIAKLLKSKGLEVAFNTMYLSKWKDDDTFISKLKGLNGVIDLFVMVDSFGGVFPDEVRQAVIKVKKEIDCSIGFHGHNNLQMGLINTITAIESGCSFVDATILGMGRGAGNLNLELLLTVLNKQGLNLDFNVLGEIISIFTPLLKQYKWGTNLPYMLAGANSIPQKEVMEWVTSRAYSFNSIVRAVNNKKNKEKDNARYPIWQVKRSEIVLIIGGGNSITKHIAAIKEFLKTHNNTILIFPTSRYVRLFKDIEVGKIYCLGGNESKRLTANIDIDNFNGICVLSPYPRTMGTEVPIFAQDSTFELKNNHFPMEYRDSCTCTALNVALEINPKQVFVVGYDGYKGDVLSEKEAMLTAENRELFSYFERLKGKKIVSLTDSLYKSLNIQSIYQYLE